MSKSCFFVTPTGQSESPERQRMRRVKDQILNNAFRDMRISHLGLEAKSAVDFNGYSTITQLIVDKIGEADLIAVDMSDGNANVFYELALCHALRKPVIHLIEQTQTPPFDVQDIPHIKYDLETDAGLNSAVSSVVQRVETIFADDSSAPYLETYPIDSLFLQTECSKPDVEIVAWEKVFDILGPRLATFSGSVHVFNAELHTLTNEKGRQFLQNLRRLGVRQMKVFLKPHVVKRFEEYLRDDRNLADALPPNLEVIAGSPPLGSDEIAFVYFQSETNDDICCLNPKTSPFATRHPRSVGVREIEFEQCIISAEKRLNQRLLSLVQEVERTFGKQGALSIRNLIDFGKGAPLSFDNVDEQHGVSSLIDSMKLHHDGEPYVAPTRETKSSLEFERQRGKFRVHLHDSFVGDGRPKPALLWMPPWGLDEKWFEYMADLDQQLGNYFHVHHIEYAALEGATSFSSAALDVADAISAIVARNDVEILDGEVVLAALSLSGFVAAEVAAQNKNVKAACLLAPATDLFEALDSFWSHSRGVDLFTRRFYFGKGGCRAADLHHGNAIEYFGRQTTPHHLLDLPLRGAGRCNEKSFFENLRTLQENGGKAFIGLAPTDFMADFERTQKACDDHNISFDEIGWSHLRKATYDKFSFKRNWCSKEQMDIKKAVEFLVSQGNSTPVPTDHITE